MRRPGRAVADGRRRRTTSRRRSPTLGAAARAQDAAATAMTARARRGSRSPARRATAWDAIGTAAGGRRSRRSTSSPNSRSSSRARQTATRAFWDSADNVHRRRHPPHTRPCPPATRSMRQVEEADAIAAPHRRRARPCRRADRRVFRLRRRPGGQRDRAARPQQRPLDDRGRRHLAVRAAYPRHLRPAARLDRARRRGASRWTI